MDNKAEREGAGSPGLAMKFENRRGVPIQVAFTPLEKKLEQWQQAGQGDKIKKVLDFQGQCLARAVGGEVDWITELQGKVDSFTMAVWDLDQVGVRAALQGRAGEGGLVDGLLEVAVLVDAFRQSGQKIEFENQGNEDGSRGFSVGLK